jgi:hypothetical protein
LLKQSSVLTLISTALHQDFTAFVVMLAVVHEIEICSHAMGHCYVMENLAL